MDGLHYDILEVDGVEFSYGAKRILNSVYLQCKQGTLVGLLGRNGSGKSTLMKVMISELDTEVKSVRINGTPFRNRMTRGCSAITYLPQGPMIPDYISIIDAFQLYQVDVSKAIREFPEIEKLLRHQPRLLSGGERRLVEILLVTLSDSKFSLMDEPFSGLSPVLIERVGKLFTQYKKKKGLIITDHLYRQVVSMSDTLYVMINGSVKRLRDANELVRYGYLERIKQQG